MKIIPKVETNTLFREEFHMKIREAARVILINPDSNVLLLQFNSAVLNLKDPNCPSFWITPGGGLEANESPEHAARRELFEETGICDATFQLPHIDYTEKKRTVFKEIMLFKEHFFVAHTNRSIITTAHCTHEEKTDLLSYKWWSLEELQTTTELVYPENLIPLIKAVIQN